VFVGRLLPLTRSFVSWPAGRARVPAVRFVGLAAAQLLGAAARRCYLRCSTGT
jgi:membrane protein DedA with SNARE-associated domain